MSYISIIDDIAGDNISNYIRQIHSFPILTEEEERELGYKWFNEKDTDAAHKLVTSHLRMVIGIANSFKKYGLSFMDLISEGNIGLMQAVKKFDPNKGYRLSTYAMWWIKASIQDYVLKSWSLVKIGTSTAKRKLFFGLRALQHKIQKGENDHLNLDTAKQISAEMSVPLSEVISMDKRLGMSDLSLDINLNNNSDDSDTTTLLDVVQGGQDHSKSYEVRDHAQQRRMDLKKAIHSLNERERHIIHARRLQEPAASLKSLASKYNISIERVRQIEKRAIEKMKTSLQ